ncbi:LysR family transcriptional regulator [Paenibacillus sp. FSL H8-0034]|uniref:LysR family transcriptional regulator n=1 Tax=Paenibacillus sp. FSL H8-0034 TaxID=2954671 RepID=UPI0030FC930E
MDLLQLKYFQTVAKYEHLSRAAEELRIAQPSLSQTISRLEKSLGYQLFTRNGRKIELNECGKAYLRRIENVFMELNEGLREMEEISRKNNEKIAIAVTIPSILPDLIVGFKNLYPQVRFRQYQSSSALMSKQLESAEIDLGISTVELISENLQWIPLLREEVLLTVPPGHRLADRTSIRLDEVKSEPFIAMPAGHGFRDITEDFCREAGFTPFTAFEGDEAGITQKLVARGLGVAFYPSITSFNSASSDTVKLRIEEPSCFRTIGLLLNKKHYLTSTVHNFIDFVIDHFEQIKITHP